MGENKETSIPGKFYAMPTKNCSNMNYQKDSLNRIALTRTWLGPSYRIIKKNPLGKYYNHENVCN